VGRLADDEEGGFEKAPEDTRFRCARNGDHLMTPFQCDSCWFRNLKHRDPLENNNRDKLLLVHIRRAILDAFWSRETGTVEPSRREGVKMCKVLAGLGLEAEDFLPPLGPFPVRDDWGMVVALATLGRSLDPGINSECVQFVTARKIRSHASSYHKVTPEGIEKWTPKMAELVGPTTELWFKRFMDGCHNRMGDQTKQDKALSTIVLLAALELLDKDWKADKAWESRFRVARLATALVTGFTGGLRGEELPKISFRHTRAVFKEAVEHSLYPHVALCLRGRFKGETGEQTHYIPLVMVSRSGIRVSMWLRRLLELMTRRGYRDGPLLVSDKGGCVTVASLDPEFHTLLRRVQVESNLIPDNVDVEGGYSIRRSLRRGSTSEAQNAGMGPDVIDFNNRWRMVERAKGKAPSGFGMAATYTEAKVAVKRLLMYSESL
jgi:hypothetical protein